MIAAVLALIGFTLLGSLSDPVRLVGALLVIAATAQVLRTWESYQEVPGVDADGGMAAGRGGTGDVGAGAGGAR